MTPTPKLSSKGKKGAKKAQIVAKLKQKMGLYFHTINHTIQVFFKVSFLGFVDAPFMSIIKYCHSHDQRASLESTLQNENAQGMILNSSSYF